MKLVKILAVVPSLLLIPFAANALTGTARSAPGHLETIPPALTGVSAAASNRLTVTFSEPMLTPGDTAQGNYNVSGPGKGTLTTNPSTVSGSGPYRLNWPVGEMMEGGLVTTVVTGVQDVVGNPIDPSANSAQCPGKGIPPALSRLTAVPARAWAGAEVALSFTSSETLQSDPTLTVNGHAASFVRASGNVYSFMYTLQDDDTPGMATVAVSGFDLAGNLGTLNSNAVLEVVVWGVPLHAWPTALLLLTVGMLMLRRSGKSRFEGSAAKQRGMFLLFVLFVLQAVLCPAAFAESPSVSNVRFTQGPNDTGGTQVDIYFDLVAPNGPCDITLSLSMNDGADGFSNPITTYTGDFADLDTRENWHIVWDIAADYAGVDMPNASILVTADDGVVQHTLTYETGPNGHLTGAAPISPQTVNDGGSGTAVTAEADPGYHFAQWSDGRTDNPRTDTGVTADIAVTAEFAINRYTLTYTADTNGSISGESLQMVDHGTDGAAVSAVPNTGYHFAQWSDGKTDNPRTDTNVTADITVKAEFVINQYTLTYIPGAGGSISGTTPQTVDYGGSGTEVTAVGDPGHPFVQWSDGSTQNPRTDINVTENITVTASFATDRYALTYLPGTGGSISGTTPQTVDYGGSGTEVTAVPETGFHFVEWSDHSMQNPRTDTNVTENITVTASFAVNTYTLTYTAGDNGTISGPSPQTVNYGATGATVMAVPAPGYHFVQWSDGILTAERTDANVAADITVTASFAINQYTLTYTAGDNGTIAGTSPQIVNHGDSGTMVTAVPDPGYHFLQWSDGILTAARTDANVTADITVSASFAINQYTLTYTAGDNGTIAGTSPQTVNYGGSGMEVTAVPNDGYAFSQWSDGVMTAARTDTNVIADIAVTASFTAASLSPAVTSFAINNDAATTMSLAVTLNNTATNSPAEYLASESSDFTGAVWTTYSTAPAFTLSFGVGTRTVYFKVRNGAGVSGVASDTILVVPDTVSVAGGTFSMGRLASGFNDDRTYGDSNEDPVHSVELGAYRLGKYEVTNKEYCDVLNWAKAQGYLYSDTAGTPWPGSGDIYAGGAGFRNLIVSFANAECNITYSGGQFLSKTRTGLPVGTPYSMDTHPMVWVSWYGCVAYCNWLSQWQGLTPCYSMDAADWPLTVAPPTSGGYRLPTEAEWERAAAWDGSRHWVYGFMSDELTGSSHANYFADPNWVNPLGLTDMPYSSPVGWFNGKNVSPNGGVATGNSVSPVGAYDMSGNVYEWVGDWYAAYGSAAQANPTGPVLGVYRVIRDGGWDWYNDVCRSAARHYDPSGATVDSVGFRVAKS